MTKSKLFVTGIVVFGMFYSAEWMKYALACANVQMMRYTHENVNYSV